MSHHEHKAIIREGHNGWRQENARQVAIDGEACFRAVREAILAARRSVSIPGWDIHSKLKLVRDGEKDGYPVKSGASRHQKIVVVDDAVAFSGGIDLSKWRWDTPEHRIAIVLVVIE